MDPEEYANYKVTAEMNPEQYVKLCGALGDWIDEHKNDPDAQQTIKDLESIQFKRTQ